MNNSLYLGRTKSIKLPRCAFLYIDDELPKKTLAKVFDPLTHSLDPIGRISEAEAKHLAKMIYLAYPQGENTLTVRTGQINLAKLLHVNDRLDLIDTKDEEARLIIDDLLFLPLLKRVLCPTDNSTFRQKPMQTVVARLNRAEIGDFAAFIIGQILISQWKGQVIIPDFGFYGRETHISLVRENRLIAGVNFLGELPLRLRNAVLLIGDKHAHHALYDDAELLAKFKGLRPDPTRDDNDFNKFVRSAMAS